MALTYRTAGAWGAGKGSNLTPTEYDQNVYELAQAVAAAEGIAPYQITEIEVINNQMTIHLDGGTSFGPYDLPVATFQWRGAWAPETQYYLGDFFNAADGFYFSTRDFISNAGVFLPLYGDGGGPYAHLIIPYPNLYTVAAFFPGTVGYGVFAESSDSAAMFMHLFAHEVYFLAELPLAQAALYVPPTADVSYPIVKLTRDSSGVTTETIGAVEFALGEDEGTFTFDLDVQFGPGDRMAILRMGTLDDTARDFTVTIPGIKGTIPEAPSS